MSKTDGFAVYEVTDSHPVWSHPAFVDAQHHKLTEFSKKLSDLVEAPLTPVRLKAATHHKRSTPVALLRIGDTIRLARETVGLNQRQLGEKMGVARTYISKIENGVVEPNIESLLRFADALGIPAWKILRRAERTAQRE